MSEFPWDPRLETGNEMIDEQHRELFALANELQDAVHALGSNRDTIEDAVYALTEYCVEHFEDEQQLMQQSGYPDYDAHCRMHRALSVKTMQMTARFFNGDDLKPADLAPFLVDWLVNHIESVDMRFVTWLARGRES